MGVRGRSIRGARRSRSAALRPSSAAAAGAAAAAAGAAAAAAPASPTAAPATAAAPTASDWGYCTEEQLEELLLTNLDLVYREALSRLLALGHDHPTALRALLSNGYCYGANDVLTSILNNSLAFLNSPDSVPLPRPPFPDLRSLHHHSLTAMLAILQQVRPSLSRGDAMWCLLMSELHVGRATTLDTPSDSLLKGMEGMALSEPDPSTDPSDDKNEMVLALVRQIRELEVQVAERREWAQEKALQAARKVSADLAELNALRAEREENQNLLTKKGLDEPTMKRLADMEAALKRASREVDRANSAVRQLEIENAEIRAEMEAAKLSASESVKTRQEAEKREKKSLKRLHAWEKLREKMLEEVAEVRRKIAQVQQEFNEVEESNKQTEMKWRQAIKGKELAIAQVEEERRAKEAVEVSIKRRHGSLRQKNEIDSQRYKDDIQRLEEELSRLQASARVVSNPKSNDSSEVDASKPRKEVNSKMLKGSTKPQVTPPNKNRSRECIVCMQEEVSVVYLPCRHQVICTRCNEEHKKMGKTSCPCCNIQIEERIRVFGVNS